MTYRYKGKRRTSPFVVPTVLHWDMRSAATVAALILIVLLAFAGLALLGHSYTFDERGLSWTDWRVLQAEQAYHAELGDLQRDAEALIDLLNGRVPDPVRAQIVADQIAARHGDGQPALARLRELLVQAATAVEDWAIGATSRDAAQTAVDNLITSLRDADERNPAH